MAKGTTKKKIHEVKPIEVQSILNCVPTGYVLRQGQIELLLTLEKRWANHDVFIIQAPVGSGKSVIEQTLARWLNSFGIGVATITPQVFLQNQYEKSFPDIVNVKGASRYECGSHRNLTCGAVKDIFDGCCGGCAYMAAVGAVSESKNVVCNFYSYIQHKAYKPVLCIDEAHNTFKFLQEFLTVTFWADKHDIPKDTPTYGDLAVWIEELMTQLQKDLTIWTKSAVKARLILDKHKDDETIRENAIQSLAEAGKAIQDGKHNLRRYKMAYEAMVKCPEPMFIERLFQERYGKKVECIRMRPKTMEGLPKILWPANMVNKVVLMSGTINELDTQKLGLNDKRVTTITVANPIPAEQRPIVPLTNCNLSYAYQDKNVPKLVKILKGLLEEHPDTKGVVHMTYGLAAKIWPLVNDPRYLFHSSDDREARLKEFLETTEPRVLVACGMSEGLDLAGAGYSWQVIAKIMYPNRSDKLVEALYQQEPDYMAWETAKTTIQQTGRICRGPTDYGVTYIIDTAFGNPETRQYGLYQSAGQFFTKDFKEALQWRRGQELAKKLA
jgi:Rad3-related DNA helicase